MRSINFDGGYKTYAINGDENCTIKIQVTDFNLPKRINDALTEIEGVVEKAKGNRSDEDMASFDTEIRATINKVFGSDICTPAFGIANVCSIASNGEPIFYNFFNALLPIVKEDIETAAKAAEVRPEVQKYLEEGK